MILFILSTPIMREEDATRLRDAFGAGLLTPPKRSTEGLLFSSIALGN